ncbi:thioesterase [Pectobacterium sp. F1-1]|uniref:thioesterase II family protein n=1 Tax=Pectobacterium sp. F1-1 TaxID=2949614 RepID=UPI0021D7B925|nr:alpha/beta fold hydrolase [Pectobacterium sp. F1-1]UYA58849.1 thioesterase [Pectobacterium sp. F1-1]
MSPWFHTLLPRPAAALRLICLPFAGGSASHYQPFANGLPPWVELCAAQLPGRSTRLREAPCLRVAEVVEALRQHIPLDKPWLLFGHSLGCRLGMSLMQALQEHGQRLPLHFIASGCRPLHLIRDISPMSSLSDAAFIQRLQGYGGTPPELLAHQELMALVLPMLRADFRLVEDYHLSSVTPLPLPVTIMGGRQDQNVPLMELPQWQTLFTDPVTVRLFDGGHFFIQQQRQAVLEALTQILQRYHVDESIEDTSCVRSPSLLTRK